MTHVYYHVLYLSICTTKFDTQKESAEYRKQVLETGVGNSAATVLGIRSCSCSNFNKVTKRKEKLLSGSCGQDSVRVSMSVAVGNIRFCDVVLPVGIFQ